MAGRTVVRKLARVNPWFPRGPPPVRKRELVPGLPRE
jgi:hypothetical protein